MAPQLYQCPACGQPVSYSAPGCPRCGWRPGPPPIQPAPAKKAQQLALVATGFAALIAVGSFLPWAAAGAGLLSASRTGIEGGDGWITLGIGAAAAYVAIRAWLDSRIPHPGKMVAAGLAAAAIAVVDVLDIVGRQATSVYGVEIKPTPELGVLVVIAGGVGLAVIGVAGNRAQ